MQFSVGAKDLQLLYFDSCHQKERVCWNPLSCSKSTCWESQGKAPLLLRRLFSAVDSLQTVSTAITAHVHHLLSRPHYQEIG